LTAKQRLWISRICVIAFALAVVASIDVRAASSDQTTYVLWNLSTRTGVAAVETTYPFDLSWQLLARSARDRIAIGTDSALLLEGPGGGEVAAVPAGRPAFASFSPDGQFVAFTTQAGCPSAFSCQLYLVGADGTGEQLVADHASPATWSPDGGAIAYVRDASDASGIGALVVRSLSSRATSVYGTALTFGSPAFSPDGTRLAYVCPSGLCIVNRRTRHVSRLPQPRINGAITPSRYLQWSPNGRYLAASTASDFNLGLVVYDVRTGGVQQLSGLRFIHEVAAPLAWAPDSTTLLWGFAYDRTRIFETNVVTRKRIRMSRDDRLWYFAQWHGRSITYLTYSSTYQPSY
jgi:Tol biopolymer transport system component